MLHIFKHIDLNLWLLRKILTIILFSQTYISYNQTTIIAIRLNDTIIIGADSKAHNFKKSWNVCKIYKYKNFYYAVSGISSDTIYNFDLEVIINKNVDANREIFLTLDSLNYALCDSLINYLKRIKFNRPYVYNEFITKYRGIKIIFAIISYQIPFLVGAEYYVEYDSTMMNYYIKYKNTFCPGDSKASSNIMIIGQHKAIDGYLEDHPGFWEKNPVEAINFLIKLEIKSNPDKVGKPIDIIQITKNNYKWIQCKPECKNF